MGARIYKWMGMEIKLEINGKGYGNRNFLMGMGVRIAFPLTSTTSCLSVRLSLSELTWVIFCDP